MSKKKHNENQSTKNLLIDDLNVYILVVFGASGNLSKGKIYPALWSLYRQNLLPPRLTIIGYARSRLTVDWIKQQCGPHIKVDAADEEKYIQFWEQNRYVIGEYNTQPDYDKLNEEISLAADSSPSNRAFFLAVPSILYKKIASNIKQTLMSPNGWNKIMLEKPFGKDLSTSLKLTAHLKSLFDEEQIYRIDHYLAKEMIQNIVYLRFCNRLLAAVWNRDNIAAVLVASKEDVGIEVRPHYFEEFGIIRDMVQSHMMQIVALLSMESPSTLNSNDITYEKLKVLKQIKEVDIDDVILGQYTNQNKPVNHANHATPNTPTYFACVLQIANERWDGVPFIIECGKALDEKLTEICVQFKEIPGNLFKGASNRNDLLITIQPNRTISVKLMVKAPGSNSETQEIRLDVAPGNLYPPADFLNNYELLIKQMFDGVHDNFVRSEEIHEAWRILTPLLTQLDKLKVEPIHYSVGSTGPKERDRLLNDNNFMNKKRRGVQFFK